MPRVIRYWPKFMTPVTFKEGSVPGTPPSGEVYAYAKADGLLYSKDDAGVETVVTGGGGGGGGVAKYATTLASSAVSYTITHNLNTLDVVPTLIEVATGLIKQPDQWDITGVNTLEVSFLIAPSASQYRVVVIG